MKLTSGRKDERDQTNRRKWKFETPNAQMWHKKASSGGKVSQVRNQVYRHENQLSYEKTATSTCGR